MMNQWGKFFRTVEWAPSYFWQKATRRRSTAGRPHLIIGLADHFEPAIVPGGSDRADRREQERRLKYWCREYPGVVNEWRDSDGQAFRHTYFYPAEQYDRGLIERLAEHCHAGWGEIEIHLHHGQNAPDTSANTRRQIEEFREALVSHGCLARANGTGPARYAFVHGNFALANSGRGRFCGVDDEMKVLAETGCYADFTLPSAPNVSQTRKINALYECALPLDRAAPHRRGRDLRAGCAPQVFPLIIQGPLALDFGRNGRRWPGIENGEISGKHSPTMRRLALWQSAAITVQGRPDWIFVKLHCHGMDPRDESAMLGDAMRCFLREVAEECRAGAIGPVHYVTAREMTNIILAACDGRSGNPNEYREYRLTPISAPVRV